MAYYMGDYYQGDYYQGDPALGALIPFGLKLAKVGVGLLTRSKAGGMVARKVGRMLARPGTARVIAAAAGGAAITAAARPSIAPTMAGLPTAPGVRLPGGVSMIPSQMLPFGKPGLVSTQRPAGYHWSPKAGTWVRNRRMNVTNVRALRRSIRRATGFAKLARRVLSFVSPRAPKGKAIFRRKARR